MQFFRGGIALAEQNIAAWTNPAREFRVALIENSSSVSPGSQTLSEFLTTNTEVAGAARPQVTNRTVVLYDPVTDATRYQWAGQIDFGSPTAGQDIAGAVMFEWTGQESTSFLWQYDDGQPDFPNQTTGQQIQYGATQGVNSAGEQALILQLPETIPLHGALADLEDQAAAWSSTDDFRLRLLSTSGTTVPDPAWETLTEVMSSGAVQVTGAPDILLPRSSRVDPLWSSLNASREFYIIPASILRWAQVPPGDNVTAVLLYNSNTGRAWSWVGGFDVPTDGGDFTYGQEGQQLIFFQAA